MLAKFDAQTMEGTISGEYYRVEDVPYVMYFDNIGNAIHGTYWHSNFGAPDEPRLRQLADGHRRLDVRVGTRGHRGVRDLLIGGASGARRRGRSGLDSEATTRLGWNWLAP